MLCSRGQQTFSVKGQIVKISGFAGHIQSLLCIFLLFSCSCPSCSCDGVCGVGTWCSSSSSLLSSSSSSVSFLLHLHFLLGNHS